MNNELVTLNQEADDEVYQQLAAGMYEAKDNPIALLRCLNNLEIPWFLAQVRRHIGYKAQILDLGCGPGFFSNAAAKAGHAVTGLDISTMALKIAALRDETHSVRYVTGDAYKIPFPKESFDVVCAMDLLEHVTDLDEILVEVNRVLRPGGTFFFHTYNKNFLSWIFVIKAVEWFIKNTPSAYHVYDLLLKPADLQNLLEQLGFELHEVKGVRPCLFQKPCLDLLIHREVSPEFKFTWIKSTAVGYCGFAKKLREH